MSKRPAKAKGPEIVADAIRGIGVYLMEQAKTRRMSQKDAPELLNRVNTTVTHLRELRQEADRLSNGNSLPSIIKAFLVTERSLQAIMDGQESIALIPSNNKKPNFTTYIPAWMDNAQAVECNRLLSDAATELEATKGKAAGPLDKTVGWWTWKEAVEFVQKKLGGTESAASSQLYRWEEDDPSMKEDCRGGKWDPAKVRKYCKTPP